MPPPDLCQILHLPPVLQQEEWATDGGLDVTNYVGALDSSHVCMLLVASALLPLRQQPALTHLVSALVDRALKNHVLAAMSSEEHVSLLAAYPYVQGVQPGGQCGDGSQAAHRVKTPQALKLFRTLVDRLRDACQHLSASHLARIARAHINHWQGLDVIAASMSKQLAVLSQLAQCKPNKPRIYWTPAARGQKEAEEGKPVATDVKEPDLTKSPGQVVLNASLEDSIDLLVGLALMGSHDDMFNAPIVWTLVATALHGVSRRDCCMDRYAAAHVLVELLWSLSVAETFYMACQPAGELQKQFLNTQARLLLLLARRWSDGVLVFAPCGSEASPLSTAALTAASLAGGGRRDGVKCQVLTDLHGEMLVQVVMTASPDSLEQPSVDALVKHLREFGRQRDCARQGQCVRLLDDMHQVLKAINAPARRAVEIANGICVVGFVLEADACQSPDQSPELDSSPAPSLAASTDFAAPASVLSGARSLSRSLPDDRELHLLMANSTARMAGGAEAGGDSREVIEMYDARSDCLQRPSVLGLAYKPAGLWLHRMRLLRRRGFSVLQVGTEQWAGLMRSDGGAANGSDDKADVFKLACSLRAEWLMKLINTATWARTLSLRPGFLLPSSTVRARRGAESDSESVFGGGSAAMSARDSLCDFNDMPGSECDASDGEVSGEVGLGKSRAASPLAGAQAGGSSWCVQWSKSQKKWFYKNRRTKQKTWKPPVIAGWQIRTRQTMPPSDAAGPCPFSGLYAGLSSYYYNPETKQTSVEPPDAA